MERDLVMSTHCEIMQTAKVNTQLCDAMWQLFNGHYTGVSREVFEHDFRNKQQLLLLWRDQHLVGFTSQLFCNVGEHRVLYSGDIIIAAEMRDAGTATFFHRWAQTVWQTCDWWCALSSGARTFRIPHTFYRRVTPNRAGDETDQERKLRHRFAQHVYGDCYVPERGIVKLRHPYTQRETALNTRASYPMDAYFRECNPGWQQGDELVSLVNLHAENWKPVAMRMLHWKESGG